jgi:hypothetical protein
MPSSGSPDEIAAAELADVYAGSRRPAEGVQVLAFTRDATRHGEELRRRTRADFGVELARFTAAELDALMARIEADEDLLDAEGVGVIGALADRGRVRMEIATRTPAETVAWLYERYGEALQVELAGPVPYEEALTAADGFRETADGLEVRYGRAGELLRVETVESEDAVAVGIVERVRLGMRAAVYREAWTPVPLSAPLAGRRVRDAVSGRALP